MDIVLTYLLRNGALSAAPGHVKSVMVGFGIWLLFTKTVKLFPHFYRYPEDLWLLPVHVIFGYFHGFIKIYALLTINRVSQFRDLEQNGY